MRLSHTLPLFFAALLCATLLTAQVQVPAFTGYALPVEKTNGEGESVLFDALVGLHNWTNTGQQLQYFFNITTAGDLSIALFIKNARPGSTLQIAAAGKKFVLNVPAGTAFKKVVAGTIHQLPTGFCSVTISALHKAGTTIAAIQSIELAGTAAAGVQFNAKPRRNAASVHLLYALPDTAKAVSFYSELTVPVGADPLYTYYMANGFARGYFGMQVNSQQERRVIFSIWDAGKEAVDRNKVSTDNKVQLLAKGRDVVASDFGNEGTGGHSHLVYHWKAGEQYKFLVTALPDSASNTTIYTGYFFMPELQKWKLIAAFKAPKDGKYLNGLYSFVENFDGINGQQQRKALFGNQWTRNENGQWNEITAASFSYDATGKAGDRIDYGGGVENNQFYLLNGGFHLPEAKYKDLFTRNAIAKTPIVDLYKNVDSAQQLLTDRQLIYDAIAEKKLDTTGSKDGIYYFMLKEGTGGYVSLTDTVLAFYKGALLSGDVFDETKEKPASFPLARLIKGWQLGLPLCRVGGKIRLIIPSALAYGIRTRSAKIPPNSVLVFDIDVVETRKAAN